MFLISSLYSFCLISWVITRVGTINEKAVINEMILITALVDNEIIIKLLCFAYIF